ncbi:MAG: L,D-transpeptidase family protein [Gammaproteobacteria bacterium]|nr:L,D-transpeptidase family protein [Gammaproteobacteria bacterium]
MIQWIAKLTLVLWVGLAPFAAWGQTASEQLRRTVEHVNVNGDADVAGARLVSVDFLARFYAARRFAPAWSNTRDVELLMAELEGSEAHGLSPPDFHVDAIQLLRQMQAEQPDDPRINASLDLLLTDGLAIYAHQLVDGKVDPSLLSAFWNQSRQELSRGRVEGLADALAQNSLPEFLASLVPSLPYYRDMRARLASYRAIASRGGWPSVPDGAALRRGDEDPRVAAVRARLAVEPTSLGSSRPDPNVFDVTLEESVSRFQVEHGLEVDGEVGPATLRAMNVSVAERIDQLRVNLERARWVQDEFTNMNDFVIVNIAGFYVRLYEDGEIDWESRVIVGTEYDQTPAVVADMTYLVLNPTWTVPRSIIRDEMLPEMKADPGYLSARNLDLFDQEWRRMDPAMLDWENVSASDFPYYVMQRPGPGNALGTVKFMFPNAHSVYLHDTPSPELFSRSRRTFSHGCVRVQNPLEFAVRLLEDQPDWTQEAIDRAIDDGQTTTVYLTTPVRVVILYRTAEPADGGRVRFYEDIYARDPAVLAALDSDFRPLDPP